MGHVHGNSGDGKVALATDAPPSTAQHGNVLAERHMLRALLGDVLCQMPSNTLLASLSGHAVPSTMPGSRRLAIMTYNMWRTEPYDNPESPAGQPFTKRQAAMQAFFNVHQHIDIFALQEADSVLMGHVQVNTHVPNASPVAHDPRKYDCSMV